MIYIVISSRNEEIKERKREMANKVANISDLIHRVASSCLTHNLPPGSLHGQPISDDGDDDDDHLSSSELERSETPTTYQEEQEQESLESLTIAWEDEKRAEVVERVKEMETIMSQVFEAVSAVKKAYVSLQEAHCPWDPDKMRVADAAVVAELRMLGRMRDRFRRGTAAAGAAAAAPLREVVAPYEAALEELRRELKAKEVEVEGLKEKLTVRSSSRGSGIKKGSRINYGKKVGCISGLGERFQFGFFGNTPLAFTIFALMRHAR